MAPASRKICQVPGCQYGDPDSNGVWGPYVTDPECVRRKEVLNDLNSHVEMAHKFLMRQAKDETKKIATKAQLIDAEAKKIAAQTAANIQLQVNNEVGDSETASDTTSNTQNTRRFADKWDSLPRPRLEDNCSQSDWKFFATQWKRYTEGVNMSPAQQVQHLWAACSETLQRNLHMGRGNKILDPKQLLDHLHFIAVQRKNNLVNIVDMQRMGQNTNETTLQFSNRLNGQADLCDFSVNCPNCQESVSYKDLTIMH